MTDSTQISNNRSSQLFC